MRFLALLVIASCMAPLGAHAQPAADAARHQNDCRIAVQVVTTGQPQARQEWALSKIRSCGADAGRALASIIPRLREVPDTARLNRYFSATREVYDGQIFDAAFAIAGDRTASTPARVFALRSLIWSGNPGRLLSYTDLAGDASGRTHCAGGFTSHVSLTAGAPLPAGYDARVRELAARLARDSSVPVEVRRAAQCAKLTTRSTWIDEWLKR